jgi:hypothetical protein
MVRIKERRCPSQLRDSSCCCYILILRLNKDNGKEKEIAAWKFRLNYAAANQGLKKCLIAELRGLTVARPRTPES